MKNTAINAVKSIKEGINNVLEHSSFQAKGEIKVTEKVGAQFELKGIGGAGLSLTTGEASITSELNLGLKDGEITSNFNTSEDIYSTFEVTGQVGGNGAKYKYSIEPEGGTSAEGAITTSTNIPGVQTETSYKFGSKTTEVSFGVAVGTKAPVAVSNNLKLVHISAGVSVLDKDIVDEPFQNLNSVFRTLYNE
ncbi:hypothetical protein [Flammeovirga sp. SubArs3]|uniref:hypothetical protein n=1 Tax=Flammeovirga sp. SubArs3 TaxID=2995316 RepID=UPI00248B7E9D|nr:hypothetical protein [Flammeovirga sp. SubArs3]